MDTRLSYLFQMESIFREEVIEVAIKGCVMIAFLTYLVLALAKLMVPEIQPRTADTLMEELRSFSVTTLDEDDWKKRRIYSNFGLII